MCFAAVVCVAAIVAPGKPALGAPENLSQPRYKVHHETKVPVPMRDGLKLGASIYRPDAPGKFPGLLVLRYFRGQHQDAWGKYYAERGYAVALVDSRGRGDSEGKWVHYVREPKDGFDTQEWLGTQPWCTGDIGGMDISYNGFTQLMPAVLGNPHFKCMVPLECQQTNFGHIYIDGVMQLNVVFEAGLFTRGKSATATTFQPNHPHYKQLPLIDTVDKFPDVPHVKEWFRHPQYDDYWKAYGIKEKYGQIKAPAYFVTGWYDNLLNEGFRNFQGFRDQGGNAKVRQGTKILVGPWIHGGSLGYADLNVMQLRWFDYWLKGIDNGIASEAPIKIYVMGADVWRSENEWPLARARVTNLYLGGQGKANSAAGDGMLSTKAPSGTSSVDKFVYDPQNPVYSLGGQISTVVPGPRDRRSVQDRQDVLVYTSDSLKEDVEITGPISLKLYAASSVVDTDFTATLTDLSPNDKAIHICEGVLGVKYRESLEHPTPIKPGQIYGLTVSLWETSNVFKKGHRLRLEVSSSNFPRFARNQNTGLPFGTSAKMVKAEQTIYHDADHPSHLILPVISGRLD